MKNKFLVFSTLAASLILTSCSKEDAVNPAGPALTSETENPSQKVMQGTIYGVDWNVGTAQSTIYNVNNSTGVTSNPREITNGGFDGDLVNVAGIARESANNVIM